VALITGDQLKAVAKIFGLRASQTSAFTDLDTEHVQQVLEISGIVRSSSQIGPVSGWFLGVLQNVHPGAGDLVSTMNPYEPGAAATQQFPRSVPQGWDIWCHGASMRRSAGAGTLTSGFLAINGDPQGWGRNNSGVTITDTPEQVVCHWNSIAPDVPTPALTPSGDTYVPVRMRIPRNSDFEYRTVAAGASANFDLAIVLGLFPAGIGQDLGW